LVVVIASANPVFLWRIGGSGQPAWGRRGPGRIKYVRNEPSEFPIFAAKQKAELFSEFSIFAAKQKAEIF
jgi:hypothetical protein